MIKRGVVIVGVSIGKAGRVDLILFLLGSVDGIFDFSLRFQRRPQLTNDVLVG